MKFLLMLALLFLSVAASALQAAPAPTPRPRGFLFFRPAPKATPPPRLVTPPKRLSSPTPPPRPTPVPTPMVALPNYNEETSTRLQIFLDNRNFGPGKIDGEMGEFFRKALLSYKRANNLPTTGAVDASFLAEVPVAYTNYVIPPEAVNFVGPLSSRPSEQAQMKALRYGSLLELVCERFHAAEAFVRKLNPGANLDQLQPGDIVRVPNVKPFEIEHLREGFMPDNPELAGRKIVIDTHERFLEIHEGDKLIAEFPITPGSRTLPAPIGTWKILGIATLPWFRHDEGVLNAGVKTDNFYNLPAGPNNPVGVLWMGLNKPHVGVHGTNNPETIGRAASHGCIRLANWDAARVKDLVTKQNVVEIF
ncbi:MAG: L,D-transpeptidase family protein [Chthoniobacterales bacterium]|nr:L,D-transpeptidase family protein [Chthoniobacterales bacterium]